jgi:hypothetical protein
MARKPTELVPLMLRLRESLRKQLEKAAKAHDVSMNTEINDRLEHSFEREKQEARDTAIVDAIAGSGLNREILQAAIHILREQPERRGELESRIREIAGEIVWPPELEPADPEDEE